MRSYRSTIAASENWTPSACPCDDARYFGRRPGRLGGSGLALRAVALSDALHRYRRPTTAANNPAATPITPLRRDRNAALPEDRSHSWS